MKKYKCTECGAQDSDREMYTPAPLALACWNCKAGIRMSVPEQVAHSVGMLQDNSNEE